MVTDEEMKQFKNQEIKTVKSSLLVTDEEMKRFDTEWELADKIGNRKKQFEKENGLKPYPAYEELEDLCQINVTSIRKSISGSNKVTRKFLYKFTVGLRMSVKEANEYFALCGGELNLDDKPDYICYRALKDGDTIYQFIEQYQQYTHLKIELN